MVNLTEKIREICKKLETEGFNNVRFDNLYVEEEKLEDYWDEITKEGELTPQQFADWTRDHVAFVAEPRRPYCFNVMDFDNPYIDEPMFNEDKFIDDLTAYIRSEVGEGVAIKYRSGCCEFEVYRERSSEKNS